MMLTSTVRAPAIAGLFYPAAKDELRRTVDELLAAGEQQADATVPAGCSPFPKAIIAPHAGYIYSGATAARIYAHLKPWRSQIRRVVLLGPTHRVSVRGLALPAVTHFRTPLGDIPLDSEHMSALRELPQITVSDAAHAREHSLEVHLPFLQSVLDRFTLLPLAVGQATAEETAEVLAHVWGSDDTLIVISSDLSHFHPYTEAQQLDRATADAILALRSDLTGSQACGCRPVSGLTLLARERGLTPALIDLCNSGDTAGDRQRVVGYAAFAFHEPLFL
jgi:AmmeMemoRadiSam system protein B